MNSTRSKDIIRITTEGKPRQQLATLSREQLYDLLKNKKHVAENKLYNPRTLKKSLHFKAKNLLENYISIIDVINSLETEVFIQIYPRYYLFVRKKAEVEELFYSPCFGILRYNDDIIFFCVNDTSL